MDEEREFSIDDRETRFVETARLIGQLQAGLLEDLDWFDAAQVFNADGTRNLSEWVAQKLDVSAATARAIVQTMRRTQNKPHLRRTLSEGLVSFDRVEALSKISGETELLEHLDIAGVHRTAADRIEITSDDEVTSAQDQYLVMQPSLDESWWRIHGGLDGYSGALVDKVLTEAADQLPDFPNGEKTSLGWRKATALTQLCVSDKPLPAQVTVFVDADTATETDGRAGVRLEAGPRVGAQALSAILCDSITEITVNTSDGVPLRYGRSSRTIPPALRRAMLATTAGFCAIDGCNSRYRIQVHHRTPWSEGGTTDPENLLPLCWFHHQIVIHERGFELFQHHEHGRWRLRRPQDNSSDVVRVMVHAGPGVKP